MMRYVFYSDPNLDDEDAYYDLCEEHENALKKISKLIKDVSKFKQQNIIKDERIIELEKKISFDKEEKDTLQKEIDSYKEDI